MKRPLVITLLVLALLFVLAGIGAVVFFTVRNVGSFVLEQTYVSVTAEESKTLQVEDGPIRLIVDDGAGNVTVIGGDGDSVEVEVFKTGSAPTHARAEQDLEDLQYDISQDGNTITLTYELDRIKTNHVDTVDFTITVPIETSVDVETSLGEVSVSGINGDTTITNDFGNINVENIAGALSANSNSGRLKVNAVKAGSRDINIHSGFGQVTVEQLSGKNITITSSSGTIELNNIRATGDLLTSSDFGNVTYENGSSASLDVGTKSGKVSITKVNVRGQLKIQNDFGEIELVQAMAGSYDMHTNSGSIDVDGAQNSLKAHTDFGSITIKNAESTTLDLDTQSGTIEYRGSLGPGPHMVISDFGQIDLYIPTDTNLKMSLETDFGNISSEIPITVILEGNLEKNKQEGSINGGGDLLTVRTKSGDINIAAIE
ncbi:MAG: DUF4097 family beta strand repeat-containing protein [Anaerolineales bacterium]